MKVGILTYHWVANFGANLQTLSTINYLIKRGDEPIVINWIPEDLENIYNKSITSEQIIVHKEFAEQFYTVTKICRNSVEIADEIRSNQIGFVIVGSDAVLAYIPVLERFKLSKRGLWYYKQAIDSDFPNSFWGDFISLTSKVPVALMSASAQHTKFHLIRSNSRKKEFNNALSQFSFISVRDIWTKKMVNYLTNNTIDPAITPDPVFAFNYNHPIYFTKEQIRKKFNLPKKYILFSAPPEILKDDWIFHIQKLFLNEGYTSIELPKPSGFQNMILNDKIFLPISPLEWYYLIKYSGGYIGELMHPILVSLHNSVPFFSFDTYGFKRGGKMKFESSKIFHILSKYDFLDHYYSVVHHDKFPTPPEVYNAIKYFDFKKCEEKSVMMYDEYKQMMEELFKHSKSPMEKEIN